MISSEIDRLPPGALLYHPDVQVHTVIVHKDEQFLGYIQVGRTHVFLSPAFVERTRSIRFSKALLVWRTGAWSKAVRIA